ncbi:CGNR zinc finger domain-containing protein [Kribbella sp. NPDC026611]|uniref:CGNR zinc finger domain-containing protein n=1 Tax=Kribbella sp. NPDC026611 TaxID=3154911 RepID=UPI00340EF597
MVEPGNAREEFSALGGHRALDLVNTVAWRLDPQRWADKLVDDDSALRWAWEFGLCTEAETVLAEGLLLGLRSVREDIYNAVLHADSDSAARLTELYREWWQRTDLQVDPQRRWQPTERYVDGRTIMLRAARDGVQLLLAGTPNLKQCADDTCGWLYLDTSPRHNRRWCAPNDCGARNRSKTHYYRQRSGAKP